MLLHASEIGDPAEMHVCRDVALSDGVLKGLSN
jgi:hypothetical protein